MRVSQHPHKNIANKRSHFLYPATHSRGSVNWQCFGIDWVNDRSDSEPIILRETSYETGESVWQRKYTLLKCSRQGSDRNEFVRSLKLHKANCSYFKHTKTACFITGHGVSHD